MRKIIFANLPKLHRAQNILDVLRNGSKTEEEKTLGARFTELLAEAKLDIKDEEECVEFIYEKLGGLIQTEEEVKEVKAKSENLSRKVSGKTTPKSAPKSDKKEKIEDEEMNEE